MYLILENGQPSHFSNTRENDTAIEVEDWQNDIDCFVPSGNTFVFDTNAKLGRDVRLERDLRLLKSDWTQVADAPVDQQAWQTYRQALRDIPQQAGFPDTIVWPVEP